MKKIKLALALALAVPFNAAAVTLDLGHADFAVVNAPGTAFNTMEEDSYVEVGALEIMSFADMLMCIVGTSGAPLIPNGEYRALADFALCGAGDPTTPNVSEMLVSSQRLNNTSDQTSKIWIEYVTPTEVQNIHLKAQMSQAPTTLNPIGEWQLGWEFQSVPPMEVGYISASPGSNLTPVVSVVIKNNEAAGAPSDPTVTGTKTVRATFDVDGATSGSGIIETVYTGAFGDKGTSGTVVPFTASDDTTTRIKITGDHVLTQVDSVAAVCLDVDDLTDDVWEYNLYTASGELVDIQSTLEFTATVGGSSTIGVIGGYTYNNTSKYWIWVEDEDAEPASITANGQTYNLTWSSGSVDTAVLAGTTTPLEFDEALAFDLAANPADPMVDRNAADLTTLFAADNTNFHQVGTSGFGLYYDGPGRLNGFKYATSGPRSGKPLVGLIDGTKLTHADGTEYFVKASNIARTPSDVTVSGAACPAPDALLSFGASPALPDAALAIAPTGMASADKPANTVETLVVDGELQ